MGGPVMLQTKTVKYPENIVIQIPRLKTKLDLELKPIANIDSKDYFQLLPLESRKGFDTSFIYDIFYGLLEHGYRFLDVRNKTDENIATLFNLGRENWTSIFFSEKEDFNFWYYLGQHNPQSQLGYDITLDEGKYFAVYPRMDIKDRQLLVKKFQNRQRLFFCNCSITSQNSSIQ